MKKLYAAALAAGLLACVAHAKAEEPAVDGAQTLLTRSDAIARTFEDDPGLAAAMAGLRSAEASARQAGARPNPTAVLELENFGGKSPFGAFDKAEATYSFVQELELGGDRHARRKLAERQSAAVRIENELRALDLRESVELAFVEAQAAEAIAEIVQSRLSVVNEFARDVDRRVKAARDPAVALARVTARLAETQVAAETMQARVAASKARLASYWGGDSNFAIETATFFDLSSKPTSSTTSPDLALARAHKESADARVAVEHAKRIPNPDVKAGFRQFRDVNSSAFIVGLSVPLPVWNRNSGGLAAARADRMRAEYEVEARSRTISRETALLLSQVETTRAEIEAYTARIIPSSERALVQSLEAYAQGGLSYLEVLEAQQSLADAKLRQIAALRTFHQTEARLSRRRGDRLLLPTQENSK